jgi:hypothetical protein
VREAKGISQSRDVCSKKPSPPFVRLQCCCRLRAVHGISIRITIKQIVELIEKVQDVPSGLPVHFILVCPRCKTVFFELREA